MTKEGPEFSSHWDESRIMMLVAGQVEENSTLEYKRAAALDRSDSKKKIEITKDVSAFANSAGGTLIYGIAEGTGDHAHIPARIDPIDRREYSKEWLEQMISAIQPKIAGLVIHTIQIGASEHDVCYAIDIPESNTAHQASDSRYYRRGNFIAEPMKDYEVRLVMNRSRHPRLELEVRLISELYGMEFTVHIQIRNTGPRIAKQYMVEVAVPASTNGSKYAPDDDRSIICDDGYWRVILPTGVNPKPIFPSSTKTLNVKVSLVRSCNFAVTEAPDDQIVCRLFADEMPFIESKVSIGRI